MDVGHNGAYLVILNSSELSVHLHAALISLAMELSWELSLGLPLRYKGDNVLQDERPD